MGIGYSHLMLSLHWRYPTGWKQLLNYKENPPDHSRHQGSPHERHVSNRASLQEQADPVASNEETRSPPQSFPLQTPPLQAFFQQTLPKKTSSPNTSLQQTLFTQTPSQKTSNQSSCPKILPQQEYSPQIHQHTLDPEETPHQNNTFFHSEQLLQNQTECLVDIKIIMVVSNAIGKQWKWLGRMMEIQDKVLNSIEKEYSSDDLDEMAYKMLQVWKERMPQGATVKILAQHLNSINRKDLANKILRMIESQKSSGIKDSSQASEIEETEVLLSSSEDNKREIQTMQCGPSSSKTVMQTMESKIAIQDTCSGANSNFFGPVNMGGNQTVQLAQKLEDQITLERRFFDHGLRLNKEKCIQILTSEDVEVDHEKLEAIVMLKTSIKQVEIHRLIDVWKSLQVFLQNEHENLQIPTMPWLGDWELEFDRYYIELSIRSKTDKTSKSLQLNEIFQPTEGKTPDRILIQAPAGYGKSTLALKLCYDHAKGEEYIRHFDAVIVLRLRELQTSLNDLIANTLEIADEYRQKALDAIKVYQNKILFVLDGMDEMPQDKYKEIRSFLGGKRRSESVLDGMGEMPQDKYREIIPFLGRRSESTVIVTSRMESIRLKRENVELSLTNLLQCMQSRIVIKGVTGVNRIRFLQMYLNHCHDKLESVLTSVEGRFELLFQTKLFNSPLFLLLLVIVAEESDICILKTKTELYKMLFNFILRRMFAKNSITDEKYDFFEFDIDSPPAYVQMFSRFGSLAIRALDKGQYSFTAEEIRFHCGSDDILKLGILTHNDSKSGLKRKFWYEPVHLSFLEFSAAYHICLTHTHIQRRDLVFYARYVSSTSENLSFEFLFALSKNQLFDLCLELGKGWKNETLLSMCIKYEKQLEADLKLPKLAEALLPLVPAVFFLPEEEYCLSSALLKETMALASRTNRLKRLILINTLDINRGYKHPLELLRSIKVEGDLVSSDDTLREVWSEVITHQDLMIDVSITKSHCNICTLELKICESSLDQQLQWLSNWFSVKGLLLNKPIHKIIYKMHFMSDLKETLGKITELIRKEKVESVRITNDCMMPAQPWKDLIQHANQSKRLLDMEIIGDKWKKTILVDLSGSEEKTWSKVVLRKNVVLHDGQPVVLSGGYCGWEVESGVKNIQSNCIEYLFVEQSWIKYLFVQGNTSPICRHLRELFITIDSPLQLEQKWDWLNLNNLQVLCVEFFPMFKFDEMDLISSSLLAMISLCHPRMRLEFWQYCSDEFVHNFLWKMNEVKCSDRKKQEVKAPTKLETLVLSRAMALYGIELSKRTLKLIKELLLSGQLGHLWVSSHYVTCEITEQFSLVEGFDCKVKFQTEEDTRWQPDGIHVDDYCIDISVKKSS